MRFKGIVISLVVLASLAEGYRILCLFPSNGKSHYIMYDALCKSLARKGHRVDMISHFPAKTPTPNYTNIIDLSGRIEDMANSLSIEDARRHHKRISYNLATTYGYEFCKLMEHEKMKGFIKNPPYDPPYDLLITEYFGAICYLGFGELLKVPVVLAISSLDMPYIHEILGTPWNNAFFPGQRLEDVKLTSFWDRLRNTWSNFIETRLFFYYSSPQTEIMRKYLGANLSDIREIEKKTAMVLVNTHRTFHGVRTTSPALVEVGGLHIEEDQSKLTPELESWLDSAEHGVVYFSLGSILAIETIPKQTILDIYSSFRKIAPIKVLMKCVDEIKLPPGIPANVLVLPWIPQIPVLRHKNTRLFITHGGLMGSQEALYCSVPMIGIPVFADQLRNVNIFVQKGMAVRLEIDNINEKSLDAALNATLNDPTYKANAKKESALFMDRPMKPIDTATYWIEYIIRHGPNSLRLPASDMPWWQLHLVDIWAFLIASTTIAMYLLLMLFKILTKTVRGTVRPILSEKKKK